MTTEQENGSFFEDEKDVKLESEEQPDVNVEDILKQKDAEIERKDAEIGRLKSNLRSKEEKAKSKEIDSEVVQRLESIERMINSDKKEIEKSGKEWLKQQDWSELYDKEKNPEAYDEFMSTLRMVNSKRPVKSPEDMHKNMLKAHLVLSDSTENVNLSMGGMGSGMTPTVSKSSSSWDPAIVSAARQMGFDLNKISK